MSNALSAEAATAAIAGMDHWRVSGDGTALVATYRFADFAQALAFTNQVGALAEAANHHPDFTLGWGYVGLVLTTHDAGALTEKDIALAKQIAALAA